MTPKEESKQELERGITIIHKQETLEEITKKIDWVFERSSGFAGYRNKITNEWIYEKEFIEKYENSIGRKKTRQETLEEYDAESYLAGIKSDLAQDYWCKQQERMYSEEEVKDMLFEALYSKESECCVTHTKDSVVRAIIKQFKNK